MASLQNLEQRTAEAEKLAASLSAQVSQLEANKGETFSGLVFSRFFVSRFQMDVSHSSGLFLFFDHCH
jgi:hypothetical protein